MNNKLSQPIQRNESIKPIIMRITILLLTLIQVISFEQETTNFITLMIESGEQLPDLESHSYSTSANGYNEYLKAKAWNSKPSDATILANATDLDIPVIDLNHVVLEGGAIEIDGNASMLATRSSILEAYKYALEGDPVSAFGGVLISNKEIDMQTANEMNSLFFEVIMAPSYSNEALEILKSKKNRIILKIINIELSNKTVRTCLNGILVQERDNITDSHGGLEYVTNKRPSNQEIEDLLFASKISKHTKSNTIVLAKNSQLISSGTGQTSRVDALNQAIDKAKKFNFDLKNSVMASDAFFPFPDCVEIASQNGICSVIQPGGSIKDNLSIDYCNKNNLSMVFTGNRHFKH